VDKITAAIADPVRRDILSGLRHGQLSAGDIAQGFPISRPAVSRHLRVLRDSGLVRDELVGRRRLYTLVPDRLIPLAEWMAQFTEVPGWQSRLDALETEVYRTRRDRRGRTTQSRKGNTA
jgi:DNA-binding transcriptional ArsR family regulator